MNRTRNVLYFAIVITLVLAPVATSEESSSPEAAPSPNAQEKTKHLLRYKFTAGEVVRAKVVHQAAVRTTIDGTSSTAETVSTSIKVWKVDDVDEEGNVTFVHSVEKVDMKNDVTGRETVRYNSQTDKQPPPEFSDVAKRVGVPLTKVVMDQSGNILKREDLAPGSPNPSQLTLPLPVKPVAVGDHWKFPFSFYIQLGSGISKKIEAQQRFELLGVNGDVAHVGMETQILTPVTEPEVEAQLVQRQSNGKVKFDIGSGAVISQQIDLDRRIVGYPNPKSSMHYRTRFTETLLKAGERTAAKPK